MSEYLTADELLGRSVKRRVRVDLPDGGSVLMQSLTAKELKRLERSLYLPDGRPDKARQDLLAELTIIRTWIDADTGLPMLTDEQVGELSKLDAATFAVLADAAEKLAGTKIHYNTERLEEAKKNSSSSIGDEPGSVSREPSSSAA